MVRSVWISRTHQYSEVTFWNVSPWWRCCEWVSGVLRKHMGSASVFFWGLIDTNSYICVTLNGSRRSQGCLNKSKQFPGSLYKCRGNNYDKTYPTMREELYCCRDVDYCNRHVLAPGGLAPPHSTQEAPPWLAPGEKGGEGKASTSPASPPSNRLDCHH